MSKRKLTEDDVRLIRQCHNEKVKLRKEIKQLENLALAEKFDVTPSTIADICAYKRYKNVRD